MSVARYLLLVCMGLWLSGCGIFGGGDDEELEPKKLVDIEESLPVKRIWKAKLGDDSEFLRVSLWPAGDGTRIYAASRDGNVVAFDPVSGDRLWRTKTEVLLSAGPGVGSGLVIVAGSNGELIALSAEDGSERWRRNIDGESLATPIVRGNNLIVFTIDGKLRSLATFDGSERWSIEQSLPALTLRGAAAPAIVGSSVIAGFDNGRLIAVNLSDGTTEWEAMLSPPSGRSDLDRLADVDGAITVVGQDIYASGYQGRLASVAAESGQVIWARELSTHAGVSADWNNVYTSTADGEIVAMSRRTGSDEWRNDSLLRREPTMPVPFDTTVVVGDLEGYVHFFSNLDGDPVARRRVGKGMISGIPVVIGGRLYVQSESGVLSAFAVPQPEPQPEPVADEDS